jgi:excisionase family DNA binding protein
MKSLQINNLEVNELQELIENSVKKALGQTASRQEPEPEFMTRFEVVEMLQISLVTLNDWMKQGKIPTLKIGRLVRFKKADVINALKERQTLNYGRVK